MKNAGVAKRMIVWTSLIHLFEVYHIAFTQWLFNKLRVNFRRHADVTKILISHLVVNQMLQLNICDASNYNGWVHHKVLTVGVAKTYIGWNIEDAMVKLKHFHAAIYI